VVESTAEAESAPAHLCDCSSTAFSTIDFALFSPLTCTWIHANPGMIRRLPTRQCLFLEY
jgi:hypothetical protein